MAIFRILPVINTKNVCTSEEEAPGTVTTVPSSVGMPAANITTTIRLDHKN
jgi:hypothetical protein